MGKLLSTEVIQKDKKVEKRKLVIGNRVRLCRDPRGLFSKGSAKPPADPLEVEGIDTYRGDIPNNPTVPNNGLSIAVCREKQLPSLALITVGYTN